MNLSYRNQITAAAISKIWNKPLDKTDWYKINAEASEDVEILIYDVIGWPWMDANLFVNEIKQYKGRPITIGINSPGGDLVDAIAIFQSIKRHDAKVTVRIDSLAASSAGIIAMGGDEVTAYKTSTFMIHNPWFFTIGNEFAHEEAMEILKQFSTKSIDIYSSKASIGKRDIKLLMNGSGKRDGTWLTAYEAKEKGFIDKIIDGKNESIKNQFDLSIFDNIQKAIDIEGNEDKHEPTIRQMEQALRDVGLPLNKAKAMLAGSKPDEADKEEIEKLKATINELEIKAALQKTILSIGGK